MSNYVVYPTIKGLRPKITKYKLNFGAFRPISIFVYTSCILVHTISYICSKHLYSQGHALRFLRMADSIKVEFESLWLSRNAREWRDQMDLNG
uniref:Putative ovule protein n=1 Tax=Solanum chacoense TaxID=4108 RepID=A0A0V0I6X6_SOLCH